MTNGAGSGGIPCAVLEFPDTGDPARPDRAVLSWRRRTAGQIVRFIVPTVEVH